MGEAAADALLGALDPARKRAFRDRYLGLPLDLTGVLFVGAATDPGRIPPLLRERLEPLPLAGYDDEEKYRIATRHLIRQRLALIRQRLARHGLSPDELSFSPAVLRLLLRGYAREPGVRLLDDSIDTLCRRAARLRADGSSPPGGMKPETVARWLGAPRNGIERVMTTETEFKISEEPLAERVLRQVRSGTLDESRLLPSAEKRARDVGKKLDRLAAREGWYTFMAGQAYAVATGKAPLRRNAEVMAVEQVTRWRSEVSRFAPDRLAEFDELIGEALNNPAPVQKPEQ